MCQSYLQIIRVERVISWNSHCLFRWGEQLKDKYSLPASRLGHLGDDAAAVSFDFHLNASHIWLLLCPTVTEDRKTETITDGWPDILNYFAVKASKVNRQIA